MKKGEDFSPNFGEYNRINRQTKKRVYDKNGYGKNGYGKNGYGKNGYGKRIRD